METTLINIEELKIDESKILKVISDNLNIKTNQVSSVIKLLDEGNTIPFISRYRKEVTGSLDETEVRNIKNLLDSQRNLEERKVEIIKSINGQGLLDNVIYENILKAKTLTEVEELYAPYKKKKKTRAMIAIEKGLEGLANIILLSNEKTIEQKANDYINVEKGVNNIQEAILGACDIIAERSSQDVEFRNKIREFFNNRVFLVTEGKKEADKSVYKIYYSYKELVKNVKPHHILAINRGENDDELKVKFDFEEKDLINIAEGYYKLNNKYYYEAIEDSLKRLIIPSITREIRSNTTEKAEEHSINIFGKNLSDLLMQPPIKRTRIIAMDPGIRTGTKCVVIDENGKYIDSFLIYQHQKDKSSQIIKDYVKKFNTELIAIGNGTGSYEVQELVAETISNNNLSVKYTVVPEDGASVYSASEVAVEEFPNLDVTVRGAISIGRRIQDPLSELVKIDPKSIGVGLYQHDVNQKKLSESLDQVVESVVNQVGVNLNTASTQLLKYISGINSKLAKNIVKYREENGLIKSRKELKDISGIGAKVFEQCSGFLMIPESENILDNTWIHPENYKAGKAIYDLILKNQNLTKEQREELKNKYSIGDTTINDLIDTLKKHRRDPREDYPQPIMQSGVVKFEDLKVGMKVTGKVKNVVDFGAFIDLGLKETALLHVSEMSNKFIKSPMEVVKIGDVLQLKIISIDEVRKRVSVSLKG